MGRSVVCLVLFFNLTLIHFNLNGYVRLVPAVIETTPIWISVNEKETMIILGE